MTDHRSELRRELVAAAARRAEELESRPASTAGRPGEGSDRVRRLLLVAASIVLVVGAVTISLDADPASADVFEVRTTETEVIVSVAGAVKDPDAAAAELREVGLDVTMIGRPVPPSLVGAVTATSGAFGPLEFENDGERITAFRIRRSETGAISVEYGRPYEIRAAVSERYGPKIVWQVLGATVQTDVPLADLPPDARVVLVMPMDPNTVLVAVTEGESTSPSELGC